MKKYVAPTKLPKAMVFKVSRIEVLRDYCCFEAIPEFKDGSSMGTDYIMDMEFLFFLQRKHEKWRVINDISSTDVPSDIQLKQMSDSFPKDFPFELIPKFWREHFDRVTKGPTKRSSVTAHAASSSMVSPSKLSVCCCLPLPGRSSS